MSKKTGLVSLVAAATLVGSAVFGAAFAPGTIAELPAAADSVPQLGESGDKIHFAVIFNAYSVTGHGNLFYRDKSKDENIGSWTEVRESITSDWTDVADDKQNGFTRSVDDGKGVGKVSYIVYDLGDKAHKYPHYVNISVDDTYFNSYYPIPVQLGKAEMGKSCQVIDYLGNSDRTLQCNVVALWSGDRNYLPDDQMWHVQFRVTKK